MRAKHRLVPCIDRKDETNELLVIEVEPGDLVHANQKDEVFLRVGDENRKLNFAQRRELLYDKGQASYEAGPSGASVDPVDEPFLEGYAIAMSAPDSEASVARAWFGGRQRADDRRLPAICRVAASAPTRGAH